MIQSSLFSLRFALVAALFLASLESSISSCRAQFDTIINVPPDAPLESIESNTQLNLFDGGALPSSTFVGGLNGTASNAEFKRE